MDPASWDRLEALLAAGGALPPSERAAFAEREAPDDPALRAELASLLAVYDRSDERLDRLRREVLGTDVQGILREAQQAAEEPDPWIGRTVSHYEIVDRIGGGGMGVIYRARDLRLDRQVALKFIAPELRRDSEARRRFQHEARAASALDHPNICTIHDIEETDDGRSFIVMAAYEGGTLRDRIARGPLPPAEALSLAEQVAAALAAAHAGGIVHRDVKPDNVFVTSDGVVKLLDFGLSGSTEAGMSGSGGLGGTAAYLSPEQARGRRGDARSDVWALGVVLCELLTGARPFQGVAPAEVVGRILADEPDLGALPQECLPGGEAVIARALAKDPAARFADAGEFLEALRAWREELRRATESARWKRRRTWLVGGAAGVIILAAGIARWIGATGTAPPGAAPLVAAAPGAHVLWVDDDPVNNAPFIRDLEARGVTVTTAVSTEEGLRLYDPAVHWLVLSDMGRPEGVNQEFIPTAGLVLLERLRARWPGARVVFFTTARTAEANRDRAMAGGALALIHEWDDMLRLVVESAPGAEEAAASER